MKFWGFAGQDKVTYGLGYNLILKRNHNDNVVHRGNTVANAKVIIKDISWYVEQFTPNLDNQQLIADQLLSGLRLQNYIMKNVVFLEKR